jgi:mannose-6-phosphate isomerase-like protein (cupin superfamily)
MATWTLTHLGRIEDVGGWVPIRRELGIDAFGVNAWLTRPDGTLISSHDEVSTRHQELYLVVRGHATFLLDDEEVEARSGSIVYVPDPATM